MLIYLIDFCQFEFNASFLFLYYFYRGWSHLFSLYQIKPNKIFCFWNEDIDVYNSDDEFCFYPSNCDLFSTLPDEVLLHILQYLSPSTLFNGGRALEQVHDYAPEPVRWLLSLLQLLNIPKNCWLIYFFALTFVGDFTSW